MKPVSALFAPFCKESRYSLQCTLRDFFASYHSVFKYSSAPSIPLTNKGAIMQGCGYILFVSLNKLPVNHKHVLKH